MCETIVNFRFGVIFKCDGQCSKLSSVSKLKPETKGSRKLWKLEHVEDIICFAHELRHFYV